MHCSCIFFLKQPRRHRCQCLQPVVVPLAAAGRLACHPRRSRHCCCFCGCSRLKPKHEVRLFTRRVARLEPCRRLLPRRRLLPVPPAAYRPCQPVRELGLLAVVAALGGGSRRCYSILPPLSLYLFVLSLTLSLSFPIFLPSLWFVSLLETASQACFTSL